MKILSIIGIILSTFFIIWIGIAIASDGRISMEEAGPFIIIYGLYGLALSIVGVVSATENEKLRKKLW